MIKNCISCFLVSYVTLVSGCVNQQSVQSTPLTQPLELTPQQLNSLQTAANARNGAAAYQIALYYGYVVFDENKCRIWLERAAKLKYLPAMESLGNMLVESSRREDRIRGQRLLEEVHAAKKNR